jgi:hypothetical protein
MLEDDSDELPSFMNIFSRARPTVPQVIPPMAVLTAVPKHVVQGEKPSLIFRRLVEMVSLKRRAKEHALLSWHGLDGNNTLSLVSFTPPTLPSLLVSSEF